MEMQKNSTETNKQSIREIKIGATYKHYSGKQYKVIAIAIDSENPSQRQVIYQSLYDCPTFGPNAIWSRPYTMFAENVIINGIEQPRFEEVID